ncbi:MAG: protein jag [Armatimonadota bacterium]
MATDDADRTINRAVEAALRRLGLADGEQAPPAPEPEQAPEQEAAADQPAAEAQPGPEEAAEQGPATDGPLATGAAEAASRIIELMGLDAQVAIKGQRDGGLLLEISGRDVALLIGRHGETLDALQLVTASIANRASAEKGRIVLDAENYRARRAQMLEKMARSYAARARETKKEAVLSDLKPYERRIVHMALVDEPGVTTYSEGEGRNRKLIISPCD